MSIDDWRSNARPPQFETLEQRLERTAEERRTWHETGERDRRVGAAVMAWECPGCGNTFAPRRFPNSCGYCMGSLRDAVSAALREEVGR